MATNTKRTPDVSLLESRLLYDQKSGGFYRKLKSGELKIVSSVAADGYTRIKVSGTYYKAHRLAWKMIHGFDPELQIDHIDGDKTNNRIDNLRLATASQQQMNKKNYGGMPKGVRHRYGARYGSRYTAQICKDGQSKHLGTFSSPEKAHAAYLDAAKELFGNFLCVHR